LKKIVNGLNPYTLYLSTHNGIDMRDKGLNLGADSQNQPLYYLDGVIIDKAKMDAINPIDIASINVLKDKSATILYGEKAKNGVILITSKQKASPVNVRKAE
jgi:TonB-dependent SusC/RagA subfamily outer membrane receptor